MRQPGLTPWFEWVPSSRNIAAQLGAGRPFPIYVAGEFNNIRSLYRHILEAKEAIISGRPAPPIRSPMEGNNGFPYVLRPSALEMMGDPTNDVFVHKCEKLLLTIGKNH